MEQRRHWGGLQTLQELEFPKRVRRAYEGVAGEAAKRRCKAGGMFRPKGADQAGSGSQGSSVEGCAGETQQETGARFGSASDGAGGSGDNGRRWDGYRRCNGRGGGSGWKGSRGSSGDTGGELGEDWRAAQGDVLVRGLEEVGLQVEVDGAVGDPHLSTELRRLGRGQGYWGVVVHDNSITIARARWWRRVLCSRAEGGPRDECSKSWRWR